MEHTIMDRPVRRALAVFLAVVLCLGLLPGTAFAAQTGSTDANRTVFDALGFDTSAPKGYQQEEGITDTPFGKTYTTMAEVDELFILNTNSNNDRDGKVRTAYLFGHDKKTGDSIDSFFSGEKSTETNSYTYADAALTVEGNFSTDNNGQKKNVASLSYYNWYRNGAHNESIYLLFGSATEPSEFTRKRLSPSYLGNDADVNSETYFEDQTAPYRYMQLAAGDFDGDGIDEIAVYLGVKRRNVDHNQITVYKLQKTDGDSYKTDGNWTAAWKYALPEMNGGRVPDQVSLVAADVDKNGVDDLAFAYGDTGGSSAVASKVLVFLGADKGEMLSRQYELALGTVYRAGLAVGDVDSDGRNELIVGGSPNLSNKKTRSLAIYAWNGTDFDRLVSDTVTPDGKYLSDPALAANVAVGSFYGVTEGPCIYMDSILLKYSSNGLDILATVDCQTNNNLKTSYKEWGARAADFTGSGQEVLCVNTAPDDDTIKAMTNYPPSQYLSFLSFGGSGQDRTWRIVKEYSSRTAVSGGGDVYNGEDELRPHAISFCLPNTDNDTIMLRYTGEHYYTYADPEVLAVLASPPYFADLANDDDDSQMIESKTSYGASKGSGGGSTYSNSFSVGVYTSWEQSFSILGVELAHAEAEASINNTFTWETQQTSSIEYQVEYATMAGLDTVVLYALPIETYVYEAAMPDGTTQTMTVNIPYQPSVRTISAEEYSQIQKVYSDLLPDVSTALTHTVGDPASYAKSVSELPNGRWMTLTYDGSFATIGQGSQNTISQSIEMTSETEKSFNYDLDVETKAGFGSGGVTVGITAGYSHGAGSVHITTAGSSYSGEMNGLPSQAQQYGYTFSWKLVGFLWQGQYPVVTYLVNDVVEPPLLPENFGASEEDTTTDQIALEWDYAGNAAGFILYRYFQSPSSSGYYQIATVGSGDYVSVSDGVKHYQYIDKGLSANTGYQYRIQTIGLSQPNTGIPSEAMSTYTKPETATPVVEVNRETLATYPDVKVSTTAYLTNSDEFQNAKVYYQWQKQSGRSWEDVSGETAATLTFQYPDRGVEGVYRCKVSALVDQNLVAAYSPEVTVTFAQRASEITDLTIADQTLTATVTGSGTSSKPSGTVTFILSATDGTETIYTAAVGQDGKASVTIAPPAAIYKVTASYSGSKIFLPASYDPETPIFYTKGMTSGSFLDVKDSYTYGDAFNFQKYTVNADGSVDKEPFTASDWGEWIHQSDGRDYGMSNVEERFKAGRAGWSGDVTFTDDGKTYNVHIDPRPVEIVGLTSGVYPYGTVKNTLLEGVTFTNLVSDWEKEDLTAGENRKVTVSITNLSGVKADDLGEPGTYKVRITAIGNTNTWRSVNYEVTCPTVQIVITGQGYPVSAAVAEGQDTWGAVKVTYPEDASTATVGQTLIFQAAANQGYTVKGWYTTDASGENKTPVAGSEGKDSLTLTQTKAGTHVIVEFQKKSNTLTASATPDGTGRVTTTDKYFKNGNTYNKDYEIEFKAEPNDGWHFTGWEYYEAGQSVLYGSEDTYTVVMPDNSVQLVAKFERDAYALTLSKGLAAYVNGQRVTDLSAITGDTQVTVKPAPGFDLNADAVWMVDGTALDPQPTAGEHTFSITADTSVSVDVTAQEFDVTLLMQGVTGGKAGLTGTTDGRAAAGTQVTYSAEASRGYTFDGWRDADGKTVSESADYTFAVSGEITLTPIFTEKAFKTFTVGEKIDWVITDAAGDPIITEETKLYPGETLTLTANPRSGEMVKGWTVNELYTADTAKTKTFAYKDLANPTEFRVTTQPITYFTVRFAGNIAATADGNAIKTGDRVGASSELKFTYTGQGTVTKWLNDGVAYSLTRELVVNGLTDDLNITVETGNLVFFSVTDANTVGQEGYTATVTGAYEGTGDNVGKYAENTSVTLIVTPAGGYQITGVTFGGATFTQDEDTGIWTGTVERIQSALTFTVTAEKKQTPPAPGTTYTITFDANHGTLSGDSKATTGTDGKLIALPSDPTRDGYKFDGWYTAKTGGEKVDTAKTYTENTTLYAHWTKESTGGGGGGGGISAPATYPVTAPSKPEGGSVSIDKKDAAKGDTVTITVKPDEGQKIDKVTVTDKDGKAIDVKDLGDGKYSFTMPAGKVEIEATFVADGTAGSSFVDVTSGDYFYDAVLWAVEKGITNGTDEEHFSPNDSCTRAQIVTFLWRAAGSPEPKAASSFTDVPADSYYAKAVAWAVENGITTGTTETTFSPDATCTREQAVTFLYRAAGSPAADGDSAFRDVAENAYYAGAVVWAEKNEITGGIGGGLFGTGDDCTRAQIVTFLYRTLT